jgi:hypothetical protein
LSISVSNNLLNYTDPDGLGIFGDNGLSSLLRLNNVDGRVVEICKLEIREEAFVPVSHQLVTSSGQIIDLSNGPSGRRVGLSAKALSKLGRLAYQLQPPS